jgi:pimeloyl-ACP methyl ester carboxylesterase
MRRTFAGWTDTNLFVHDFRLCDQYRNGLEAAARVTCPVTVVLAERDQMTNPKGAREVAQALSARVVMLPGGHAMMQEAPDAALAALQEALR